MGRAGSRTKLAVPAFSLPALLCVYIWVRTAQPACVSYPQAVCPRFRIPQNMYNFIVKKATYINRENEKMFKRSYLKRISNLQGRQDLCSQQCLILPSWIVVMMNISLWQCDIDGGIYLPRLCSLKARESSRCSLFHIALIAWWFLADKTSTVLNISLSAFIQLQSFSLPSYTGIALDRKWGKRRKPIWSFFNLTPMCSGVHCAVMAGNCDAKWRSAGCHFSEVCRNIFQYSVCVQLQYF